MIFGGLEPQWYIIDPKSYITQRVVFTTRPFPRCWKPTAIYSAYFFLQHVQLKFNHFQFKLHNLFTLFFPNNFQITKWQA